MVQMDVGKLFVQIEIHIAQNIFQLFVAHNCATSGGIFLVDSFLHLDKDRMAFVEGLLACETEEAVNPMRNASKAAV